jgi:GDP-mannose 6-dehydrogenase
VTAGCLARDGHDVIGVDTNKQKVDLINDGETPILEPGLAEIIADAVQVGRLRATTLAGPAVLDCDVAIISVGTPSSTNGNIDLSFIRTVCEEIGGHLAHRDDHFEVIVRSTVLPGTTRDTVIPTLEAASGKRAVQDFGVVFNPEFLREGSSIDDYDRPARIVIGGEAEPQSSRCAELFGDLGAPMISADLEAAEMVKYVDNTWHALKVAFANEIGRIGKAVGIDSREVMEIFALDTKLNISSAYLRPGFAFGGSCLPKDVRALRYYARRHDVHAPVIESVLPSNVDHVEQAFRAVVAQGKRRVAILGLAFKAGTDDLRESPMVDLVERLIGKGFDVRIHDPDVNLATLVGSNQDYLNHHIAHVSQLLLPTVADVLDHGETIVLGTGHALFDAVPDALRPDQTMIDLVGIPTRDLSGAFDYEGICW